MAKQKQLDLFFDFTEETPTVEEILATNDTIAIEEAILEEAQPIIAESNPIETAVALPKAGIRGRKSIKAMAAIADLIEVPNDEQLYSKQYYTMREVTAMFKVNHSLLRFWETQFDILQPRKNKKGDRLFRPEDVKNLEIIHYLLRVKKLTIEGAKDYFKNKKKLHQQFETIQQLQQLKDFLLEMKANLG